MTATTAPTTPRARPRSGDARAGATSTWSWRSVREGVPRGAWWVLNAALAVLVLYPFYVMSAQSLKRPDEAVAAPPTLYPHHFSLANYQHLFSGSAGVDVGRSLLNSIGVTLATTLGVSVIATLAGYGFARLRFRGSNLVFFAVLASFMIPFQAVITPLFLVLRGLGLGGSLVGLTLVYITFNLPFGIFIMRNAFAALPASLEEAALIDGCGTVGAMLRVLLPVAVPGLITTALFTFFAAWNEFFAALILITDQARFTLPVVLTLLSSGDFGTVNWGALQAGVVVTAAPCLAVYVVLQRYYVGGLLAGAVK